MAQPLWRTVWRFLKKLKIELPYDPATPLLGLYPEKNENTNLQRYIHPSVHSNTVYNSQKAEATQVFITDEWINKIWYTHTMKNYLDLSKLNCFNGWNTLRGCQREAGS